MHYALPPRKSSGRPPAYAIKRGSTARRVTPTVVVLSILATLSGFWLVAKLFGSTTRATAGLVVNTDGATSEPVVVVTVFDELTDKPIEPFVRQNRIVYAKRHGYATYFPTAQNYTLKPSPMSWAKVPAIRQAMTVFPKAKYIFHLDPHVLIMNHQLSIESHIMAKSRLESLMITEVPVVPPDSVIKTFSGLRANRVDFVITQDREGLSEKSFILRTGEWAKFFLDVWFDPLYRTYNFQRAERHALEHIVQWHGTVLAKLALVPQNIMNSYHEKQAKSATDNGIYKEGDFILNFGDCGKKERNCEIEMKPYYARSMQQYDSKA